MKIMVPIIGAATATTATAAAWIGPHQRQDVCFARYRKYLSYPLTKKNPQPSLAYSCCSRSQGRITRRTRGLVGLHRQQRQQEVVEGDDDAAFISSSSSSPATTQPPPPTAMVDCFHQDMLRVLNSRKPALEPMLEQSRERRNRPVILESDIDGAEKIVTMLQRLISIGTATEESFQIALRAIVRRDRMRWYKTVLPPEGDEEEGGPDEQQEEEGANSRRRRNRQICAADQAEELLEKLIRLQSSRNVSMETYNLVLQAYATCATPRGERNYAQKARQLLARLESMFGQVPVESLMHVLHAYAWEQQNLQDGTCAQQAQDILDRIESRTKGEDADEADEDDTSKILMQCYDWVIEAWSKSGTFGSAEKADKLLVKMKALNATLTEDDDIETRQLLDAQTYSNAILAWSKANEPGANERCNALLEEMLAKYKEGAFPPGSEPTLIAFNGVIASWSRQGRPDKAEEILELMQSIRPTCRELVPDAVTYNSVLHAHLRSSDKKMALERSLALVEYMHDHAEDQPAIKPNSFTYGTLMKAWIQSGHPNLAEEAERTLIQMQRSWEGGDLSLQPNNRIFNMVINAYAKSNTNSNRFAAKKALDLLSGMKRSKNVHCQPDCISYTSVIECLSKSSDPTAPQQAVALLEELFELHERTGDPAHMPNLRAFTMTILTFAKNNGSVMKARELLSQLVNLYEETQDAQLRPNEFPYNYVLNCAANTLQDQADAFRIATDVYQEMRKSDLVNPDSFTYAFWLKCCNNLLPRGSELREKCVKYAFEECKRDGLVTNELLTRLFQGSPAALVDELLELEEKANYRKLQIEHLPKSWSAKTRRNRWR